MPLSPRGHDVPVTRPDPTVGKPMWFEGRPLRIHYAKRAWEVSSRRVKIRNLVFDRQLTLLNCIDLESSQERQFRLDRIQRATVED